MATARRLRSNPRKMSVDVARELVERRRQRQELREMMVPTTLRELGRTAAKAVFMGRVSD